MILYYTGTGNSRHIARELNKNLGDEVLDLGVYIKGRKQLEVKGEKRYIFSLPIYAWRMPEIVNDLIMKAELEEGIPTYFIMNCGSDIGNSQKYITKLAKEKNLNLKGVSKVIMPENYVAMFPIPNEKDSKRLVEISNRTVKRISQKISDCEVLPNEKVLAIDNIKSGIINTLFYKFVTKAKKFYVKENCISCGHCKNVCPLNNIAMSNNIPLWKNNCTHCMACLCTCPVEAIEYGKNSQGKRRYYLD